MDGRFWRLWIRRTLRSILASALLVGIILLVIAVCIYQQAQTSDAISRFNGPVDALIVPGLIASSEPPLAQQQARLDEALRLYRLGYAKRIIIGEDSDHTGALHYLSQKAPDIDPSVFLAVQVENNEVYTFFEAVKRYQLANPSQHTYFLVVDPYSMLRSLKISQDIDLRTFAAPVKANQPIGRGEEWATLHAEAWRYFLYIILNRP